MANMPLYDYQQINRFVGAQMNDLSKCLKDQSRGGFPLLNKKRKLEYSEAEKKKWQKRQSEIRLSKFLEKFRNPYATMK